MILKITQSVFGGDGLAHLDGKAVFVEGALPGESVEVELTEIKKNFSRAKLIKVIQPSPQRITPECPHASHCGGCQYQSVPYAEELQMKQAQLGEIFRRHSFLKCLRPIIPSGSEWSYRSSLTLHPVQPSSKSTTRLGLYGKDHRTVIPVKDCLLADRAFKPLFQMELPAKRCPDRVTFKLDESGRMVDDMKESFLRMKLANESFLVHSGGFFQTNPSIAGKIFEAIRTEIQQTRPEVLFDLYAGVGALGLSGHEACGRLVFVEENPKAVQALRMNLQEREISLASVHEGRVERLFAEVLREYGCPQAMFVLDPPRAGLNRQLAGKLARQTSGRILYLSCDPVTLARDLDILTGEDGWMVSQIQPYDMFPRTAHIECLAMLRR